MVKVSCLPNKRKKITSQEQMLMIEEAAKAKKTYKHWELNTEAVSSFKLGTKISPMEMTKKKEIKVLVILFTNFNKFIYIIHI